MKIDMNNFPDVHFTLTPADREAGSRIGSFHNEKFDGNPAFPAPSTVDTRYLNEDLPFGLAPWSSIGRKWGIPTPNIDAVIRIASTMVGVDYFTKGLKVEDLGIKDMNPKDVKMMLE